MRYSAVALGLALATGTLVYSQTMVLHDKECSNYSHGCPDLHCQMLSSTCTDGGNVNVAFDYLEQWSPLLGDCVMGSGDCYQTDNQASCITRKYQSSFWWGDCAWLVCTDTAEKPSCE